MYVLARERKENDGYLVGYMDIDNNKRKGYNLVEFVIVRIVKASLPGSSSQMS